MLFILDMTVMEKYMQQTYEFEMELLLHKPHSQMLYYNVSVNRQERKMAALYLIAQLLNFSLVLFLFLAGLERKIS